MALWDTLGFIVSHPVGRQGRLRALARFARWQVGSRILPGGSVVDFVGGTRLLVRPSMTGATGNVYVGIHDFEEMGFLLHFLRRDDLFADVGANVGAYSVLAAGACGARVRAFEPASVAFAHLEDNVALNRLAERVVARKAAVGASPGSVELTCGLDSVNHVATGGPREGLAVETVPQVRLDDEFDEAPIAVKIDVEGFEARVLEGMSRCLASGRLHAVILELNASGTLYGVEDRELRRTLADAGFRECSYDPLRRALTLRPPDFSAPGNSIFVRGQAAVEERIRSAPRLVVHGLEF